MELDILWTVKYLTKDIYSYDGDLEKYLTATQMIRLWLSLAWNGSETMPHILHYCIATKSGIKM